MLIIIGGETTLSLAFERIETCFLLLPFGHDQSMNLPGIKTESRNSDMFACLLSEAYSPWKPSIWTCISYFKSRFSFVMLVFREIDSYCKSYQLKNRRVSHLTGDSLGRVAHHVSWHHTCQAKRWGIQQVWWNHWAFLGESLLTCSNLK